MQAMASRGLSRRCATPASRGMAPRRLLAARVHALREETPEQAKERRMREDARVDERVVAIRSMADWKREAAAASESHKLIVLEAESEKHCSPSGVVADGEFDADDAMEAAYRVRHTFARTARECPDSKFLLLEVSDAATEEVAHELGIEVLPTVQFYRDGRKLWEHKGLTNLDEDLNQGIVFFQNAPVGGLTAADITELPGQPELDAFVKQQPQDVLTVVDVSLGSADCCIHVYPAILALARNFKGFAAFGRVLADASPAARAVLTTYKVEEVPTFLFFKNGEEVARHVGTSRGDLIARILEVQQRYGVAPPPPPGSQSGSRAIKRNVGRRSLEKAGIKAKKLL
ncbi:MAG: hypothetical protein J3K34DRAFT_440870 [Monoraphidium minutum]|nr:MAG: hypothetical protein J3K34DRAFT_440870 [Monoraphidium minutum]